MVKKLSLSLVMMVLMCVGMAAQVTVSVSPNTVNLTSGQTQQFKATVVGNANTAVVWFDCNGQKVTVNATGLFTAPVVTKPTTYCIFADSVADPSKSATGHAYVSPSVIVVVPPVKIPLTATPVPLTGTAPLTVNFMATCPTCTVYTWNFGDSSSAGNSPASMTHTYTVPGNYKCTVTATDSKGISYSADMAVIVTVADTVTATLSIFSGDYATVGMPVTYAYTLSSSKGVLKTISMDCGDGTPPQVQNLFSNPPVPGVLTITGENGVTSANVCDPIIVGTLHPKIIVTDSLNKSATASITNTTLPLGGCGESTGVDFAYTLPYWIKPLTWTNPADIVYGGTATAQTSTPDTQVLTATHTIQGYGMPYCLWLGAGGGTPPYTFSATGLPQGLTVQQVLPTQGLLSGGPTVAGSYPLVLKVTDSKGAISTLNRVLNVCDQFQLMGTTCSNPASLTAKARH
jgi:hypothetical protein